MSRDEIIDKSLREMGIALPSGESALSRHEATQLSIIIAGLWLRLPDGNIKTCGAFKHLNVGCCAPYNTSCPHTDKNLIELVDGTKAWVCCAVEWEAFPEG